MLRRAAWAAIVIAIIAFLPVQREGKSDPYTGLSYWDGHIAIVDMVQLGLRIENVRVLDVRFSVVTVLISSMRRI